MQIILVSRGRKGPKTLDLTCLRMRCKMTAIALAGFIGIAGVGAAVALAIASPKAVPVQAGDANAQVARIKRDAQRDLDALAVKLGQLQAQSVRLNALGERLTQVGKLDDGEFNFDEEPGQGGLEVSAGPDPITYAQPESLGKGIELLSGQFDGQQAQLEALRDMLMDRSIESSLRPTGMPVNGYISSYFGGRPDPFSGHSARHTGIDIAAPTGTPVTAVAEGLVTFAGQRNGYGDVVEIDHGNGYMTRYAHNSVLVAQPGQRVRVGDVIAKAGSTGRSTGSHVHFEVWYHDRVVNPLAFVKSHR